MASLCFSSTISQLLPPEVSAYRLRSSPHASHFRLTSPGLLGRFTLRYPSSPLNFNPLCLSPLQASSTRYRPTSCISCSLGDDKASRTGQTGNSGNPDGGHTASNVNPFESAQKAPAFPRPLALTSAAAISAALALSALPALAADVTSFESLPQVESVSFRDASAQEKGVILASSSLTAPSLDRSSELTPSMPTPTSSNSLLSPAYPASSSLAIAVSEAESAPGAPSILDSAVTVTLSGSVSDASKSGPILQLASREAASRGMVNTCTNLLAACVLLVWFQRVGTLPPSTADVLAQVSNRVLIPCFLAVHVASAVSSAPESVLSSLPLIAFAQLLCAASLGHLVRTHAHQSSSSSPSSSPPPFPLSSLFSSSLLPRPPHLSPRPSTALHQLAASIASTLSPLDHPTTEAAADPSLRQQQAEAAVVTPLDAGLTGGLAGRGLMLLLLLAMTVSSEACGDSLAAGQLALLAVGWGPALYILAYNALLWTESRTLESRAPAVGGTSRAGGKAETGPNASSTHSLPNGFFSPPVLGVLAGFLIGATPLSHLLQLPGGSDGLAATSSLLIDSGSLMAWLQWQAEEMAGCMHCFMEAASFLGSAALPLHLMALVSSLASLEPHQSQQQELPVPLASSLASSLEAPHSQHQQQAVLSPVKATCTSDAVSTPELPF